MLVIPTFELDHFKYAKQFTDNAINVYTSKETISESGIKSHRLKPIEANKAYKFGGFKVYPFNVFHDVRNYGYIIHHEEMGNVLFATDTVYLKQRFANLNQILIEANYDNDIIERNNIDMTLRSRILDSHMEFSTTKKILRANDLSQVNNIVMIHLSNGNSDKLDFVKQVKKATGKNNVFCAEKGMSIDFNLNNF